MVPDLVDIPGCPFRVLPSGIHDVTLDDIKTAFATNGERKRLFNGLVKSLKGLKKAGCSNVHLDGSFVTDKPRPSDYDGLWDPTGVDLKKIDPVFVDPKDLQKKRKKQKKKYRGELLPDTAMGNPGQPIIDFFQKDRFTGKAKGILRIALDTDPMLKGGKKK